MCILRTKCALRNRCQKGGVGTTAKRDDHSAQSLQLVLQCQQTRHKVDLTYIKLNAAHGRASGMMKRCLANL